MPTLTSYTKASEATIISTPPTADGEMAFSTDTKKLFISEGTEWRYWTADKTLGKYYLGTDQVARPFHHFDPTVNANMEDSSGQPVSNGGSIAKIKDLIGGEKIEAITALQQPTLVSDSGTTPLFLPTGDARINNLPVWQFDGNHYLEPSIEMKRQRTHVTGYTAMFVCRQTPQIKTADGSANSTYYQNNGYSPIMGIYQGISHTFRNDTNASKYIYNDVASNAFNVTNMNRYEGDQGEASLYSFRTSINPYGNFCDAEIRHITSLGSQLNSAQTEYYRASNAHPITTTWHIPMGGLRLGVNAKYSTSRFHGEIGEILIWSESLNQDDWNTAGSYLANKWGFTW